MARDKETGLSRKVDVLVSGMETIGSAQRSCDVEDMRLRFNTISEGQYASTLYKLFGKERVDKELDHFLSHKFLPRSGAGINSVLNSGFH